MAEVVTLESIKCACGHPVRVWTVLKEGPNKGRKFLKCQSENCKFWQWEDALPRGYDPSRFKSGACFRCGHYGCEITDCDRKLDWFGNKIPNEEEEIVVTVPKTTKL